MTFAGTQRRSSSSTKSSVALKTKRSRRGRPIDPTALPAFTARSMRGSTARRVLLSGVSLPAQGQTPTHARQIHRPLQVDALVPPRADRGRHEHPGESGERDGKERADHAAELEAQDQREDRTDRMQPNGVAGELR